jgi:hypothetical protein
MIIYTKRVEENMSELRIVQQEVEKPEVDQGQNGQY